MSKKTNTKKAKQLITTLTVPAKKTKKKQLKRRMKNKLKVNPAFQAMGITCKFACT